MRMAFSLLRCHLLLKLAVLVSLVSCSEQNKESRKKENREIVIVYANEATDSLGLDPDGTVDVYKGKRVTWSIDSSVKNVKSFSIERKKNSEKIFLRVDAPPSRQTTRGGGRVDWINRNDKEYEYSIHWIDDKGDPHTFDPKIAVRPSHFNFFPWLIILLVVLLGTFWFAPFRRWFK